MSTETVDAAYAQNMREIEKLHTRCRRDPVGRPGGTQHRMD